jgi:phage FluMu protein Com
MPAERLKVRCYRCNQLLAVMPNKAGAVVNCPKCQAELLIPSPEAPPQANGGGRAGSTLSESPVPDPSAAALASTSTSASPPAELPSFLEEIATIIPPELATLRPEDLRVEAEFFEGLTRGTVPPAGRAPAPPPATLPASPSPRDASDAEPPAPATFSVVLPEVVDVGRAAVEAPPPIPPSQPVVDVPPIEIEPPTILPPGTELHTVREVVLPASVVLAWSLFVLAGIAMSFAAGLLIGHFLWKHVP